jgi:hypothetical protein
MQYLLIIIGLLPLFSHAFLVNIDANEEHCYFERLKNGATFTVMFEVAEGGFLDIDILVGLLSIISYIIEFVYFKITGPANNVLYKGERESSGRYTFPANQDGIYTYCFGNKMSSMTHKSLMFTVEVKESPVTTTHSSVAGQQQQEQGSFK